MHFALGLGAASTTVLQLDAGKVQPNDFARTKKKKERKTNPLMEKKMQESSDLNVTFF